MPVEAELRRRDGAGALQDWKLKDPEVIDAGLFTDPVNDAALRAAVGTTTDVDTLNTVIGRLKKLALLTDDIKRGVTDQEKRLDYDASNNLIYVGQNLNGTATSAATWVVTKLSYTGANLTRVQVLQGSWDARASLAW